ncbi:hypothetical protein HNR19_000293 [Nocardioides thalensis]|uniref:Uncharacterized protein n=1 Tax=Nocardioides thalensis TaxID=1914755 RepID=A0A853BWW5_9ACTN|nr:hypothetical protein [Nocardioides thalensis]NYI99594.1 hypothetical protein [Nocardioides thalensis]
MKVATQSRAAEFGTSGLTQWIQDNVVTLVLLLLAVAVLWAARQGNISKGITIVAGLMLGVVVLGIASGNNATDLGDFVVGLFRGEDA